MAAIEKQVAGYANAQALRKRGSEKTGVRATRHMSVHRMQGAASGEEGLSSDGRADGATVRMPSGDGGSPLNARDLQEVPSASSDRELGGGERRELP